MYGVGKALGQLFEPVVFGVIYLSSLESIKYFFLLFLIQGAMLLTSVAGACQSLSARVPLKDVLSGGGGGVSQAWERRKLRTSVPRQGKLKTSLGSHSVA